MILALISGTIFGEVAQRTSKTGKPYASTTLRAKDWDTAQFIRVTVFSESSQADLLRLSEGDAVAVTGPLKAELYTAQNGETKIALSIIADKVLPLKQQSKEREVKPPDARSRQERLAGSWAPGGGPNDDIPFGAP
jgi:single-stranded DNA-binding protein